MSNEYQEKLRETLERFRKQCVGKSNNGDGFENTVAAINALNTSTIDELGNELMPARGISGKYVKSPQSYQDGFASATADLRNCFGIEKETK